MQLGFRNAILPRFENCFDDHAAANGKGKTIHKRRLSLFFNESARKGALTYSLNILNSTQSAFSILHFCEFYSITSNVAN